jgi:hypothetical protein
MPIYDRNSGYGDECGAPWLQDDEGNCECSTCMHIRRKAARDKYYEENGPDNWEDGDEKRRGR